MIFFKSKLIQKILLIVESKYLDRFYITNEIVDSDLLIIR